MSDSGVFFSLRQSHSIRYTSVTTPQKWNKNGSNLQAALQLFPHHRWAETQQTGGENQSFVI